MIFVALLVGPLRRLRHGVEQLAAGDLAVRVPPTSRDEVGELTRAFNEMGDSLQQKQRVQNAFGRYVNDYVLNQLLEGPEEEGRSGIEREVTILFADIRGFTHLSEGLEGAQGGRRSSTRSSSWCRTASSSAAAPSTSSSATR